MCVKSDISSSTTVYYNTVRIGETINSFEVTIGISYVKTPLDSVHVEGRMTLKRCQK
jgi:hypothetical protein